MKSDYWNVSDAQVIESTGKTLEHWRKVLAKLHVNSMKSNDVVAHLQNVHSVPRYWARTLTTWYLKQLQS
jgi:hypoxanthine phosphoribosyltransferase